MIRVMVVEDEIPILRSTCTMIERINPEFKVMFRAANGKEALDIMETETIELLVLDIQMPIMDGVEVLCKMREKKIQIPTVVLSGFQDFSYVREALRCGAIDYMIKPFKVEEWKKTLAKVEEIIWKRKTNSPLQESEITELNYEVALIVSGAYRGNIEDEEATAEDLELPVYLEEFLSLNMPIDSWWSIPVQYANERLLIMKKLGNRTQHILESMLADLEHSARWNKPFTIILSRKEHSHHSIYKENQKLHQIAKEVMYLEKGQLCIDDAEMVKKYNKEKYDTIRPMLLQVSHPEHILPVLKNALDTVNRRSVIMDLLKEGFWRYSEMFKGNYTYVELEEELISITEQTFTKVELYEKLEKIIINAFCHETFHARNKVKLAIQMKEYIDDNYMNVINNRTLSEQYGYVAAHLRDVFRKQYEISPMEYLQNIRLEKSESLLEKNQDISLKEIAEMVGFNDSLYFSKVFRKSKGMSPSEYRKRSMLNA